MQNAERKPASDQSAWRGRDIAGGAEAVKCHKNSQAIGPIYLTRRLSTLPFGYWLGFADRCPDRKRRLW